MSEVHSLGRFSDFMIRSRQGVLSLLVVDSIGLQRRLSSDQLRIGSSLLLALAPSILNLLLLPWGQACNPRATGWLAYYSVILFTLLLFPQIAWRGLVRVSRPVDELLTTDEDSQKLARTIQRQLSLPLQLAISLSFGVGSLIGLWILHDQLDVVVDLCPASYATVFLTCGLGSNSVYWLWTVPLFAVQLAQIEHLRLLQHAPAHTPGIRKLSRLLGLSTMLAGLGIVLFETPIFFAIERLGAGGFLGIIYAGGLFVSILTFLFVAVFPQIYLSRIGLREKWRILDRLSQQINFDVADLAAEEKANALLRKIDLYRKMESAPGGTVERETLFRFSLAFLALFGPFVIKWLS